MRKVKTINYFSILNIIHNTCRYFKFIVKYLLSIKGEEIH